VIVECEGALASKAWRCQVTQVTSAAWRCLQEHVVRAAAYALAWARTAGWCGASRAQRPTSNASSSGPTTKRACSTGGFECKHIPGANWSDLTGACARIPRAVTLHSIVGRCYTAAPGYAAALTTKA
jgi:hypothetical protein